MKGIWMCRSQGAPLLVMDVEGTDGRERGEDQVRKRTHGDTLKVNKCAGLRAEIGTFQHGYG